MWSALRETLTAAEAWALEDAVREHHTFPGRSHGGTTTATAKSLVAQRVAAPLRAVWAIVHSFGNPQRYKHFVRTCALAATDGAGVGCVLEVNVVSGLPATTSTERLEVLDDHHHVLSFRVMQPPPILYIPNASLSSRLRSSSSARTSHENSSPSESTEASSASAFSTGTSSPSVTLMHARSSAAEILLSASLSNAANSVPNSLAAATILSAP